MTSSFDLGINFFNYTDCHNIHNHDDFIFISKSHSITDNSKKYFRIHKKNIIKLFKFLTNNDLHLHENFNNNVPVKPYLHLFTISYCFLTSTYHLHLIYINISS